MQTPELKIRIPFDVKVWLDVYCRENNWSKNAAILRLLRLEMESAPLLIYVRQCLASEEPNGKFYSVSVGLSGDFFETEDRDEAFAAAHRKADELGLSRNTIRFEVEDLSPEHIRTDELKALAGMHGKNWADSLYAAVPQATDDQVKEQLGQATLALTDDLSAKIDLDDEQFVGELLDMMVDTFSNRWTFLHRSEAA